MADARWAWVRGTVVSVLVGCIAALGHAPFYFPVLTLAGLAAGGYVVLAADVPRHAALRAWALGIGYFGVTLSWLVEPFFVDIARHGWMAPFALLLMAAGLSLIWSIPVGLMFRLVLPRYRWLAVAFALIMAEYMRARLFGGFPWGNPGHIWIDTPFAPLAAYLGASGLGALTLLVAILLAEIVRASRQETMRAIRLSALWVAIVGLAYFSSTYRNGQTLAEDTDVTLRLVQPNAPQHLKWNPDHAFSFVSRQIEYTAAPPAVGQPEPDLIIWPETAVPTLLEWAGDVTAAIADAAHGIPVIFGVQRGEQPRYYNSLALLGAEGQVQNTYDKHHLVPFGEYIPLGNLLERFGISAFAARAGHGYSAGPGPRVMDTGAAGKVLPLICYEAIFPRHIRSAPERPDWILHATNDAWFGEYSMPYQHLAQARFRAIEFGLPVIRVANTGVSAVIDAHGDLRAEIPLGQAGFIDARLPGAAAPTPFARFGDWPLLMLVIVAIGALLAGRSRNAH
ncbi:apolipoprotein N-acyltransferase [Aliiroseovarius sp. 2305UL8-7]|uniref:apolipoprotein N-acyltransferase n=1 Tax=Aliiroseovarius conchicola TaxID=3121637 RepID=UPI003527B169